SPSNRSQYHPAICHMSGNEQSSDTKKSAVYFCRHAESRHNAFGDNSVDVDLSERGESQARALTGEFDLVLCSPMRRARRTLDLSGIRYQRLEIVPQMREWIFDLSDQMAGEPAELRESLVDIERRCQMVRERLRSLLSVNGAGVEDAAPRSVLLVSHAAFGRELFRVCGCDRPIGNIANAVIYPFNLDFSSPAS
ncbi:hypothetical protein BOX15_Mlig020676g4, partial [Macrostomum lignano]